jgi:uncharacterized membrane protein YwzB
MVIPVVPIIVAIIILALLWWVTSQFVVDPFLLKVARVVIVTVCVLWIVSALTGYGPNLSFR